MSEWYIGINESSSLSHHGILGQKWGVRRYQNPDGSLTEEGKKRYGVNYEKGIPKEKLKQALKDYNTRTGQHIKLKDARTIRVGQYLYDKNGRRVKEDSSIETKKEESDESKASNKKAIKDMTYQELVEANNRYTQEQLYLKNYGPKEKAKKESAVGKFLSTQASRAADNIANTALDAGKRYLQKQLEEALGLKEDDPYKAAPNMSALYKKPKSQWTAKDWGMDRTYGKDYQEYLKSEAMAKAKQQQAQQMAKKEQAEKEARRAEEKLNSDYLKSWGKETASSITDDRSTSQKRFDEYVKNEELNQAWDVFVNKK